MALRPPPAERLDDPNAVLSRSDLHELGYERRAVDAIFRACRVIALAGYSRPLIHVSDFGAFLEAHTYDGRTRVRRGSGLRPPSTLAHRFAETRGGSPIDRTNL